MFLSTKLITRYQQNRETRTKKRSVQEAIVAALVVFSVFVTNILVFGFTAVLPIYLVEFKKVFSELHDLVLLVIFLPAGVFGIVGIGCSTLSLSANAGLAAYFGEDSRKFIAFTTVGKALGFIIFPILTNYFIELMFWRGSLLLLAATFIHTLPCALLYSTDMYKNTRRETLAVSESNAPKDLYKSDSNVSVEQFQNVGYVEDETISNKLEISEVNNTALNHNEDINTHEKYIREAVIKALKYDNEPFVINNTQPGKEDTLDIEETAINSINSEDKETDGRSDKVQTEGKSDSKFSARLTTGLTNFSFLVFLFAIFIVYGCVVTSSSILPDYCVKQGLSPAESARVFSVGSFGRTKKRSVQEAIVAALVVFSVFVTNILIFGFSAVLPIYLVEFKKVFPDLHDLVLLIVFLPSSVFGIAGIGCASLNVSANNGLAAYFGEDSRKFIAFATDETISNKLEISEVNNTALNHNENINTNEKYIREAVIKTLKYDNEPFVINNTQPDKEDSLGIEETAINSIKSEDEVIDVRSAKESSQNT
ncbi:Hypothetical predicted protein [Octopus vulgaris]|uniref:Uncharacterized protein n=1 Tax=Octopus vulgaris TaxID=6645 RepID=A0AA36F7R3_OCTVU|nr:Hypothetical predicted protein [Octopus vulgaris]